MYIYFMYLFYCIDKYKFYYFIDMNGSARAAFLFR